MTKQELGKEIKDVLDNYDFWITWSDLAKAAMVSKSTLSKVFKGTASLENMIAVAKALNINIEITKKQ